MRTAHRVLAGLGGVVLIQVVVVLAGTGGSAAAAPRPAGAWAWPVDGDRSVLRAFAPPAHRYGTGHRGVDLAGGSGVVRAAGAGRVAYAGLLAGRGVVVVVHGDLRTTYEPVSPDVSVGEQVRAGEPIGALEGQHSGCARSCLHWGLLRGETYLDPLSLVGRGPSRLLPVPAPGPLQPPPVPPGAPAELSRVGLPPVLGTDDPPAWDLRSSRSAAAGGSVLALLVGLALLVRRPGRPDPDGPAAAGAAAPKATREDEPATVAGAHHEASVVDLIAHRTRRRA